MTVDAERWLADAGIGDAFLEPMPLREGTHHQGPLAYRLERLDATTWRMHHHPGGSVSSYDLRTPPRALADFAGRCHDLATSPESPFVRVLVAQHHRDGSEIALRSRLITRDGAAERAIATVDEFVEALGAMRIPAAELGTDAIDRLWERAGTQYEAWRAMQARATR